MQLNVHVNDVSETAFLTLQCHAADALSGKSILHDTSSIKTFELLREEFSRSESRLHRTFARKRPRKAQVLYIALRAKKYDDYIRDFIQTYPEATVVNIGCGLDHRFERVDNGHITFFDLDLPDVMQLKRQLFPGEERYHQLSQSVFDMSWMDRIKTDHLICVAEGVFMYCQADEVKTLFLRLQQNFPGSEMVCEMFSAKWLRGWRRKIMEFKLTKQLKLGERAAFQFGIHDSDEVVKWNEGIEVLDEWVYFDSDEPQLGPLRWFRKIEALRKIQWTVHYRLN